MGSEIPSSRAKESLTAFRFTEERPDAGVYLFYSFDLVNSTRLKVAHQEWPLVIHKFFDLVKSAITVRASGVIPWKYVGDEILFYKRLTDTSSLPSIVASTYEAMVTAIENLHRVFPITRSLVSVKSALWLAQTETIEPLDMERAVAKRSGVANIVLRTGGMFGSPGYDFLGPDVDIGFRILENVERRRLVVSANLAMLMLKTSVAESDIVSKLKIVSLRSLKGVWNGRPYPIIWYEPNWNDVEESFAYDEHLDSDLVREIKESNLAESSDHQIMRLRKIFNDLGIDSAQEDLVEAVHTFAVNEDSPVVISLPESKQAEVHCVAICFDSAGQALIAKRSESKKRLPGKWEFGCAQLRVGCGFKECLSERYERDFGLELSFPEKLIPVGVFEMVDEEERRLIPGIIFPATANNAAEASLRTTTQHSELAWRSLVELEEIRRDECVEGFHDSVRRAFEQWRQDQGL